MWVLRRSKVASAESEPSSAPRFPSSFEVKTNVLSKGRTVQVASLRLLHNDDFCRHPGAILNHWRIRFQVIQMDNKSPL
jgi:hypothetical protein